MKTTLYITLFFFISAMQLNAQTRRSSSEDKVAATYDLRYYNGYEHQLPEPNWEKLREINDGIGAVRDIDGNFYFYQYRSGNIIKYDKYLNNRDTLNKSVDSYYRIAPRIIPLNYGTILLRKPYHGVTRNMTGIYLDGFIPETNIPQSVSTLSTNALTYDYDRRLLYHGAQIFNSFLEPIGRLHHDDTYFYPGIIYWGNKYKWVAKLPEIDGDKNMTFFVYKQSGKKQLFSTDNEIMRVTIPNFAISNGALVNVYEYKDKLVVVRFGGSSGASSRGSILILDPSGNMGSKYKIYEHKDALWRSSKKDDYMCGGIYWKHKLMLYDERHNKYYFEFPELSK